MTDQAGPTLFDEAASAAEPEKPGRRDAFAGFLAGWRWPGAGSFERLPKAKQEAARRAAGVVEAFLKEGD